MKFLTNTSVKGKTVLLRADLNSDMVNGVVFPSERIRAAAETIKGLQRKGAKVVVIAHQGNPGKSDYGPLQEHAKFLRKYVKITYVNQVYGPKALENIRSLKPKEAILLENIRFEEDEFYPNKKKNRLVEMLIPLVDIYVNDAFSVCHRDQTSITRFPREVESYAGPLLEKEIKALEKVQNMDNALFILAGSKPESNVKLLGKNKVLAAGLFGQACLLAKGYDLGAQNKYVEQHSLTKESFPNFLKKLKRKLKNVVLPVDFAVPENGKRVEYDLEDFPQPSNAYDIGSKTIELFSKEIMNAKAVYLKGPLGKSEDPLFAKGTNKILKAIAKSKAFSLIGGGHLSNAIERSKISKKKFNHISLSGGALLRYISSEKLVGLKALGYYN